jgi:hypothetical protein
MTYAVEHFMDLGDHDLSKRLTRFLEQQYPSEKASRLACDIDCDVRTAKNILDRHWPSARHMRAIIRRFGRDVIDAVFMPEIEPVAARLAREERELEEALERKRAHRRQVEGGADRSSDRMAARPGRSSTERAA